MSVASQSEILVMFVTVDVEI